MRFADAKLFAAYQRLESGRSEEQVLARDLEKAIGDLKENPLCGVKIPSRLWPAEYVRMYGIDNLRKCDLPRGWRLLYTLVGNEIKIVSILLKWLDHKSYERRFHYKVR